MTHILAFTLGLITGPILLLAVLYYGATSDAEWEPDEPWKTRNKDHWKMQGMEDER